MALDARTVRRKLNPSALNRDLKVCHSQTGKCQSRNGTREAKQDGLSRTAVCVRFRPNHKKRDEMMEQLHCGTLVRRSKPPHSEAWTLLCNLTRNALVTVPGYGDKTKIVGKDTNFDSWLARLPPATGNHQGNQAKGLPIRKHISHLALAVWIGCSDDPTLGSAWLPEPCLCDPEIPPPLQYRPASAAATTSGEWLYRFCCLVPMPLLRECRVVLSVLPVCFVVRVIALKDAQDRLLSAHLWSL